MAGVRHGNNEPSCFPAIPGQPLTSSQFAPHPHALFFFFAALDVVSWSCFVVPELLCLRKYPPYFQADTPSFIFLLPHPLFLILPL